LLLGHTALHQVAGRHLEVEGKLPLHFVGDGRSPERFAFTGGHEGNSSGETTFTKVARPSAAPTAAATLASSMWRFEMCMTIRHPVVSLTMVNP